MSIEVACIPVTPAETVSGGWGKAPAVAVAKVDDGAIIDWRIENVGWDTLHDSGTEGSHHAMIVRFLMENGVTIVVANHMGPPMQNTLAKMGIRVALDATGDARRAIQDAIAS
jgi:predicted Fe-Mo cluster-binding NifX family protein